MKEARARLLALQDEAIPALQWILGARSPHPMEAAVGLGGGRLVSIQPSQATWWPGRSVTVVSRAKVHWRHGQRPQTEFFVTTSDNRHEDGALRLEDESGQQVSIWRLPNDPALPGLKIAMDPVGARSLLDGLDVAAGPVKLNLRSYRPTRRAVVELEAGGQRFFVKVVPPARISALQSLHTAMSPLLPVPLSHGWNQEQGLIVLQALRGASLRTCLTDTHLTPPDPLTIKSILDQLPALTGPVAASQPRQASHFLPLLTALLPESAGDIERMAGELTIAPSQEPSVSVHGDFHEAQMVVQDGRLTGLLDIDTAGLGERIDDWATLLGHLAVLHESARPAARTRIQSYARRLLSLAEDDTRDPTTLRLRIAAVIFGLASGPFRVQSATWPQETRRRLKLCEAWLESSRQVNKDERLLSSA